MNLDIDQAIKQLSKNYRLALEAGEVQLAIRINNKINQLIEYRTNIKA